jgi:glyoxylase-like metal-dependent hydrolase (beta-lactamase superfamily II)
VTAPSSAPAVVRSFHHADTGTWTHVVVDPATKRAAIVDPVLDFDPAAGVLHAGSARRVLEYVATAGLTIDWLLETHAHADHLSAAHWLRATPAAAGPAPGIGIGRGIVDVQRTFKERLGLGADFAADGSQFDRLFDDGERFRIGELEVEVLATPGHTPDGVSYRIGDAVFVGDTVFAPRGGTARCDFPGADAATLYRSIRRLYALPEATRVFLAHDYPPQGEEPLAWTTIGDERAANIHLRAETAESEFVALRTARDATLPVPRLMWHALQVNIRAGALPPADADGISRLVLPLRDERSFR